jgi:chromosome segregation ATPase
MAPSPEAVASREPTQQPDLRVAELEAQLRQLEQELAAAREKLAAANQEIEILKEAALQARRMAAGFA